jgi:coenzyme PQQ synthesis protein D (PqqD)
MQYYLIKCIITFKNRNSYYKEHPMVRIMKDPEVVETVLEDGAVFLNLKTRFYYSLNKVGYRIWQLLDVADSSEGLIQRVMVEYGADDGKVKESVSNFLNELEREQLVSLREDGTEKLPHQEIQGSVGINTHSTEKKPFVEPDLIKHDEPLHEVVQNPFDPQLPLAE